MDQQWNDLVKRFCSISDGLGMPIDDEIFKTIIALNALGITTTMSCAGHITRDGGNVRYPWVDFSTSYSTIKDLKKEQNELHKKADKLQRKLTHLRKKHAAPARIQPLLKKSHAAWHAYHSVEHELRALQVPMRRKVVEHIIQFYAHRSASFDCRLTLRLLSSTTRLESQGAADFYLTESREVQLQKLTEYREEMHAFTEFLKMTYISHDREKGDEKGSNVNI